MLHVHRIREPGNEATFADAFSKGAHIQEREYILVAPRVPLTFDPGNPDHLREIEETNALPKLIIRKARWIKPAERRRNGQTLAHATLTVTSVNAANKLIKDGLRICGSMVRPAVGRPSGVENVDRLFLPYLWTRIRELQH